MNYRIKCGKCHGTHSSIAEVQACYGGTVKTTHVAKPAEPVAKPDEPITAKQEAFLNKLLDERPAYRDVENLWPNNIAKLTKAQANVKIEEVLSVDREVEAKPSGGSLTAILTDVQDGYYAMPCKTGNNDLDFVYVTTNQGRGNPANKGKRYVKRYLGGSGPVWIEYPEQIIFAKALAALSGDELWEAQVLFGRELGHCGMCGLPLTDELSRQRGIGPVCWEK